MGKGSNSQRVKGNAQGSSSARAASLVQQDGAFSFQTFQALGGGGRGLGYVGAAAAAHSDADLDPTAAMLLNKLRKRDATTKLKTLRDLDQHLSAADDDVIGQVLPHWPRLFNRLATDADRRVREQTQRVWAILATRANKRLAPLLKSVMGNWLCAMYDPHRDVARLACTTFETVFAAEKREKTLVFCRQEILAVLQANLLQVSLETLKSANTGEDDVELNARLDRIHSTSLLSLARMLELPPDETADANVAEILSSARIWKFAKTDSGGVASALMTLVVTCTKHRPELLKPNLKKAATATLSLLSNANGAVQQAAWDALAHLVVHQETLWDAINDRKALLPPVLRCLREAGGSHPESAFSTVPLLLRRLPPKTLGSGVSLMQEILGAIEQGARLPIARRAMPHITQCFFEVAQFFLAMGEAEESGVELGLATAAAVGAAICSYLERTAFVGVSDEKMQQHVSRLALHVACARSVGDMAAAVNSLGDTLLDRLSALSAPPLPRVPLLLAADAAAGDMVQEPPAPAVHPTIVLASTVPTFVVGLCDPAHLQGATARSDAKSGANTNLDAARTATLAALQTVAGRVTQQLLATIEPLAVPAASVTPSAGAGAEGQDEGEGEDSSDRALAKSALPDPAAATATAVGGLAALTQLLSRGADVALLVPPGQDPQQFVAAQLLPALAQLIDEQGAGSPAAAAAANACVAVALRAEAAAAEETLDRVWQTCASAGAALQLVFVQALESGGAAGATAHDRLLSTGMFEAVVSATLALLASGGDGEEVPASADGSRGPTDSRTHAKLTAPLLRLCLLGGDHTAPLCRTAAAALALVAGVRVLLSDAAATLAPPEEPVAVARADVLADGQRRRAVATDVAAVLPVLVPALAAADVARAPWAGACSDQLAMAGAVLLSCAMPLYRSTCVRGDALQSDLSAVALRSLKALVQSAADDNAARWSTALKEAVVDEAWTLRERAVAAGPLLAKHHGHVASAEVERWQLLTSCHLFPASGTASLDLQSRLHLREEAMLSSARTALAVCSDDLHAFAEGELLELLPLKEDGTAAAAGEASDPAAQQLAAAVMALTCGIALLGRIPGHGPTPGTLRELALLQAHCSLLLQPASPAPVADAVLEAQTALDTWLTADVTNWSHTEAVAGTAAPSEPASARSLALMLVEDVRCGKESVRGPAVVALRKVLHATLPNVELSSDVLQTALARVAEDSGATRLGTVHVAQTVLSVVPLHSVADHSAATDTARRALGAAESSESMAEAYPDALATLLQPFAVAVACLQALLAAEELNRTLETEEPESARAAPPAAQKALERAQNLQKVQGICSDASWRLLQRALALLMVWKEDNEDVLDTDEETHEEMPVEQLALHLSLCAEAAKVFALCAHHGASRLGSEEWDFLLCTALAWLQLRPATPHCRLALSRAVTLWTILDTRMTRLLGAVEGGLPIVPVLVGVARDWKGFFAADGERQMGPLLLRALELVSARRAGLGPTVSALLHSLSRVENAVVASATQLPVSALAPLCDALFMPLDELRLCVFRVLRRFLAHYAKPGASSDSGDSAAAEEDEDVMEVSEDGTVIVIDKTPSGAFAVPEDSLEGQWFLPLLSAVGCNADESKTVEGFELRIGEAIWEQGYLYAWDLTGALVTALPQQMRPKVAARLQRSGAIAQLLTLLFDSHLSDRRMLPDTLSQQLRHPQATLGAGLAPDTAGLRVQAACVFAGLVRHVPALVRHFWQFDCPRRLKQTLADFTEAYVSPVLVESELAEAHGTILESDTSTMVVKARFGARELVAEYTIDERQMELVIVPSRSHPLRNVEVQSGQQRVGVSAAQWRRWTLQMITFIANQNGTLLEAVRMWKRNIDKRFEGVEECPVCYSVIHGTNLQVPNTKCKTCRKMFHSDCLYKWFNSSGQATCPLCRSLF